MYEVPQERKEKAAEAALAHVGFLEPGLLEGACEKLLRTVFGLFAVESVARRYREIGRQ